MTLLRTNPRLLECSPQSILGSVLQACQLGLELDGVMGQAYLVPYKSECQMQIGYRGLIDLALRSGRVAWVKASLVYSNETFEVHEGTTPQIIHRPRLTERGDMIGVYAIAMFTDGAPPAFRVLSLEDVYKRRDVSKARNSGPWKEWPEEMILKTAIRALAKHLPQCPEAQRAAVHDEYVDAGRAPAQPSIDEYSDSDYVDAEVAVDREPGQEG